MTRRRALFLDRDGTLVHAVHFPSRPEQLRLYEHVGPGLRLLQQQGFVPIVITNQSGIARGYFSESDLQAMHSFLSAQLAKEDVQLAAIYSCPHYPSGSVPAYARECACRKPEPGMLLQAAADFDIDLSRSWFIGDILDDIEAGNRAGCHTVLVDVGTEARPTTPLRVPTFVVADIQRALALVLAVDGLEQEIDLLYRPASWRRDQEMVREGLPRPLVWRAQ
jgi:D-glycero-D-manno-heptose 1,7-bisphosphate phosphatase